MYIDDHNKLQHLYYGPRVDIDDDLTYLLAESHPVSFDPENGENSRMYEYADYGNGDFRIPSFRAIYGDDGTFVSSLTFKSFEIISGLPEHVNNHPELPHFKQLNNTRSLLITLVDNLKQLNVYLRYSVFPDHDSITRSVTFTNRAQTPVFLEHVSSATVDFPAHSHDKPFYLTHLSGSWARERQVESRLLAPGLSGIESRRGASSHQQNPFVIISEGELKENEGNVYALGIVYASSFQIMVEKTQSLGLRINAGVHPDSFRWKLKQGQEFSTPEVVISFASGSAKLSHNLHALIKASILPGPERTMWTLEVPRPIMVNSWEAMYFLCTEDRILNELVQPAKELGIDMIVIDDGWFTNRWDDRRSLGDWYVDKQKFPHGLSSLADRMHSEGLQLGIWMEPEMISRDSNLFKQHPDWVLQTKGREQTESRHQLVLDLTRFEVQDFIVASVSRILRESKATYLKWDFNRHLTQVSSETCDRETQGEVFHRWTLGLYRVWHRLTSAFPHVLFESCSGGGGRFDLALLYFTPQIWTSDNTDAIARVSIQLGTSLFYPYISMASHVSASPNHQLHRSTSLVSRHFVAMSGTFGYELSLKKIVLDHEKQVIRESIRLYRDRIQPLIINSHYYRLNELVCAADKNSPQTHSWIFVSPDKSFAAMFSILTSYLQLVVRPGRQRPVGLDADATYLVEIYREKNFHLVKDKSLKLRGSTAMNAGIVLDWTHDADSAMVLFSQSE